MNEYVFGRNWKLKLRKGTSQLESELGSVELQGPCFFPVLRSVPITATSSKERGPAEGARDVGHDVMMSQGRQRMVSRNHLGESGWPGNWANQANGKLKHGQSRSVLAPWSRLVGSLTVSHCWWNRARQQEAGGAKLVLVLGTSIRFAVFQD